MDELELLVSEMLDEGSVSEVIRPAAIIPEDAARNILMELSVRDARTGGVWIPEPTMWRRFDGAFDGDGDQPGSAQLLGSIQVAYGVPTRYEITIFRATITRFGGEHGWTVTQLCDEALRYGGLSLATCPRADLQPPPRPFRFRDHT